MRANNLRKFEPRRNSFAKRGVPIFCSKFENTLASEIKFNKNYRLWTRETLVRTNVRMYSELYKFERRLTWVHPDGTQEAWQRPENM
jgi:hypothetical protein